MFAGELHPSVPQDDILNKIQHDALQHASGYELAHGATFPSEMIASFCPPHSVVVEFGAGDGKKLKSLLNFGVYAYGIEINPHASELSYKDFHNFVFRGDVRKVGQDGEHPKKFYPRIEGQDGVLVQALLANMVVDRDVRHTIQTADAFLKPRGFLFIAEPIHYSELSLLPFNKLPEYRSQSLEAWQQRWFRRYRVNETAGLPRDVFAVAEGGVLSKEQKMKLDWTDDPDRIQALIDSLYFERYARHTRFVHLRRYLKRYHFTERQTYPTVMYDRCSNPLIGVISVWQKETAHFKYHPYLKGTRIDDLQQQERQTRQLTEGVTIQEYWDRFFTSANQNLPPSIR